MTQALLAFSPPYPPESSPVFRTKPSLINGFLQADLEVLEESCMLIESLSLDVEDIRLSLARGLHFPAEHTGVPCLSTILDFIEHGTYPPLWASTLGETESKRMEKRFDICKAGLIKSVVEVAGEERNEDVLWDDSEDARPGGDFVCKMVDWIKQYVTKLDEASLQGDARLESLIKRDDMVICASLALGNLARRGTIIISRWRLPTDPKSRKNFNGASLPSPLACASPDFSALIIPIHRH